MKKRLFENILFAVCVVLMLGILQACTDPVSINDETLDTETTASLQGADNSDKAAGTTAGTSADPPDGDYTDPNRPGLVIICHIPNANTTPVTLSILPDAVADHSTHAGDYDGPCNTESKEEDDGNGDQGNDDQDDPNAAPVGSDDEGDDGSLDGDYADTGRPGQVIICHVPSTEADAPTSLSVLPSVVADHTTHPNDYDGPCTENKGTGSISGDQGDNDQDDANATPVNGGNDQGNDASTSNNGREGSGG